MLVQGIISAKYVKNEGDKLSVHQHGYLVKCITELLGVLELCLDSCASEFVLFGEQHLQQRRIHVAGRAKYLIYQPVTRRFLHLLWKATQESRC